MESATACESGDERCEEVLRLEPSLKRSIEDELGRERSVWRWTVMESVAVAGESGGSGWPRRWQITIQR